MNDNGEIFVRIVPFPCAVGGMVIPNDDGTYNVYINANLSNQRQRKAFIHELMHIERGDLYSSAPIEEIDNI